MKTVGTYFRAAREENNISFRELSRDTKIKTEFLEAIEEASWDKLPELPVLVGFVKSIADALGVSRDQAVALLRRDYTPRKVNINPHPDVRVEVRFGQRAALFVFSLFAFILMASYLYFQYKTFTSPPLLTIISPVENELVSTRVLTVRGTTDASSTVIINGQPTVVDTDGNFATEVEIVSETESMEVKAISRTGIETVISRKIQVSLQKP